MTLDRERLMSRYAPRLLQSADDLVPLDMPIDMPDQETDDERDEPAEPEETGVMVAFYLDPVTAGVLALDDDDSGGIDVEDAEELHVTLAYLGTAGIDVMPEQVPSLMDAVTAWAVGQKPISGVVAGIGLFNNADEIVTYASVDAKDMPAARQDLVGKLEAAGFTLPSEHGYIPHVTLAYGDLRTIDIPRLPLTFSTVSICIAGHRTDIPLGVQPQVARAYTQPRQALPSATSLHLHTFRMPAATTTTNDTRASVTWNPAHGGKQAAPTGTTWNPIVTTVGARTFVTAPATTEVAAMWGDPPNPSPHMLWMQGRFVGGEVPNKNNALWSIADLQMGKPTIAHGPLNWLHQDKHVIGTIADAQFVPNQSARTQADTQNLGGVNTQVPEAHITALSAVWRWLYPDEASVVEMASDSGMLAYSMECISEAVECAGQAGCGQSYPYLEFSQGKTCAHLQDRASVRRLVNPTFLGGAVIVPPTRPGWDGANANVLRRAAAMAEKAFEDAGRPDIPATTWEQMMADVLTFAGVEP